MEVEYGKIIFKFADQATATNFRNELKTNGLSKEILTPLTKSFLRMRQLDKQI